MYPILYSALFLLGFYLLYATSERAEVPSSIIKTWARRQRLLFKCSGLLLIIISVVAFVQYYGLGAGFFFAFVMLMTVASLIVLLVPIRKVLK
jgi:hypothetical protein